MKPILVAAFLALSSAPAFAENCITSIDQLEGEYTITNGPGQLINVPRVGTVPAATKATLTASFEKHGSAIGLDSEVFGDMVVDFVEITDPSKMWNFEASDVFTTISSEDFANAADCGDPTQLIHLLGTGTTELPNVGTRSIVMRLTVFSTSAIVGRMDVVMMPPDVTLQTLIYLSK